MSVLRPYQLEAIERVRACIRKGARRILLALPTGGGKTVIAAHVIVRSVASGKRVLFVAHRRELINQCFNKLVTAGIPKSEIGVLMANDPRRRPVAPVQIASIDTLRNRPKPLAELVFVDEAHRALAKSYRDLAAAYPSAVHLGLTATPYRADGRGLGDAYEALVVVASPRQLIAEGFLVEPTVFSAPDDELPNLSSVRVRGGDYDEKALAVAVDRQKLIGNIVDNWKKYAEGVRTVAFAVSVDHSRHIAERFNAAGVRAEHVDGETATEDRDAILGRLERGETRVVCSVGVLSEGWDQPSVKACILARPTKSTGLYLQQAGRILRPWNDARAVILDHAGCAAEHGLPQDDREFSLEGASKRKGAKRKAPAGKTCPVCCAALDPGVRECSLCEFVVPIQDGLPGEVEVELVELTAASMDEKRVEWERLCAKATDRGFKPGWAFHRYKEIFGVAPPKSFALPVHDAERVYSDAEKAAYLAELEETVRERGYKPGYAFVRYRAKFGEAPPSRIPTTPEAHDAQPLPPAS